MRSILPARYETAKAELLGELAEVETCSITTDFWSSCNSESYVTITCHYLTSSWELKSRVLTTYQVKMGHTAENIAAELLKVAQAWKIDNKISSIVTDSAANMKAAARLTGWKHIPCFAHTLNLIVQEASEKDVELSRVRQKGRAIVTYFKQSVKAKDKLDEVQMQTGGVEKKLIRDVVTRWNSSYYMYERIVEIYQEVNTALCFMDRNDMCLSATEIATMKDAILLLQPFEEATREISADKFVSVSKVIPLARLLQRITAQCPSSSTLKKELVASMSRRFSGNIEGNYTLAASTLLDPRFKKIGFGDTAACNQAVERLKMEVAAIIDAANNTSQLSQDNTSGSQSTSANSSNSRLWSAIDERIIAVTQTRSSTSSAIVAFRAYLDELNIPRKDNPLKWWLVKEQSLPALAHKAKSYLSIPATSVPAERLFSKAGELISLRRNRIKSKNVDMILFLNKE